MAKTSSSDTSESKIEGEAPAFDHDHATPDFGRRIRILAVSVVVVAALLSAAWFAAANYLERQVAAAFTKNNLECADLTAFGYPFRMGISCTTLAGQTEQTGDPISFEANNLRTAAQVYDPSLVIAELGTFATTLPNGQIIKLEEGTPRASIRLDGVLPARLSLDIKTPKISGLTSPLSAADIQVHFRKGTENKLDFALNGLDIKAGDAPIAQLAFDASLAGTSRIEAALAAGGDTAQALRAALRGGEGEIRTIQIAFNDGSPAQLNISGPFTIGNDGLVTGEVTLSVTNPAAFGPAFTAFAGALGLEVAPVMNIVAGAGTTKTDVVISIKDGAASIGFIPLGQIPPV
jgi:hypothetical protein